MIEDAAESVEKAGVTFEATTKDTNATEATVEGLSDAMEGTDTSVGAVKTRLEAVKPTEDPILYGDAGIGELASDPASASGLALGLAPPDSVALRATDNMDDVDDEYNIERLFEHGSLRCGDTSEQEMGPPEKHRGGARVCAFCATEKTVLWRRGWTNAGRTSSVMLCNPCGLQYKLRKMLGHVPPDRQEESVAEAVNPKANRRRAVGGSPDESVDRSRIAVKAKKLESSRANAEPKLSDMHPEITDMMSAAAEAAVAGGGVAEADSLPLALSPRPVHMIAAAATVFPSTIMTSQDGTTDGSCFVCGLDDEVDGLLCDGCNRVYHMHCLHLETVPKGDWFCAGCIRRGDVSVKGGWRRERGGGFDNKELQKLKRWRLVEDGDTIKAQVFAKYKHAAVPVWRDLFDILTTGGYEMASNFSKQHEINHPHLWRTGVRRFDGAVLSPFISAEYQTINTGNEDPHQPYYVVYSDKDWENLSEREMESAAELQLRMSPLV